jgi:MFS family permease
MRDLLRHRDFRLLLVGQTLSMFGDTAMLLTLGMWAKDLTGSNAIAGSIFAALGLPVLFAPLGGLIVDRFRRRHVMIAVDLGTAAALLLLLFVHDRSDLWILYVVAVLYGASLILFQAARSALLHTMLPDVQLGQANGSLSTVREALRLVGPAAGAGLYAWLGGHATALLDSATFLVSAAALAAMRIAEEKPTREHGEPLRAQLVTGVRHLRSTPVLRAAVVVVVVAMLALGLAEAVFFAVVDEGLGKPVTYLGVLQVAMGVGAVAGGLLITSLIPRTGELRPVGAGIGLVAVGSAMSMSGSTAVVTAAMVLLGAGLPVSVVCITTLLQRRTPGAMQGRVFTTFEMLTGVPQVASIAAGAALITVVDYRVLLAVMTGGLFLAAGYAVIRLRDAAAPADRDDLPAVEVEVPAGVHLPTPEVPERDGPVVRR